MKVSENEFYRLMDNQRYPLSQKYDPLWIYENHLGSHCLWLLEALVQKMNLKTGMRVLDMGCGKALSSIFLAKEFGLYVYAADLWVDPSDNWKRICDAGTDKLVTPIKAEAHALPFADGFFDTIISINSFQFYATCDYYLNKNMLQLLRQGGEAGIIVPGLYNEFSGGVPDHLKELWQPEFFSWHSAQWWKSHFERTGKVIVKTADELDEGEGSRIFNIWEQITGEGELLGADKGRNITFVRLMAEKR